MFFECMKENLMRKQCARRLPDWNELLVDAVRTPGVISKAYSQFWNYSVGNQLLALFECRQRRLELGPIHTFRGWHELGRFVREGEKAITLCMPITVKRNGRNSCNENSVASETEELKTIFVYRP